MSLKRLIIFAAIAALAVAANAAQVIVPAAGTGQGTAQSSWQSDVMVHNAAPRPVEMSMTLHVGTEVYGPVALTLAAKETRGMFDIAKSVFKLTSGTGALVFDVADRDLKYLAVTSRTYNLQLLHDRTDGAFSELGQDIPAVRDEDAVTAGQIAVLTNPGYSIALFRFNFGLYALEPTTVRWEVMRADGELAATKEVSYAAGQHVQHNNGVMSPDFLNTVAKLGDSLYARVITGKAVIYGSMINNFGDPTFVPANITREDVLINFGVDIDEDGHVDVLDEDGDGVLDAPLVVYTSLYPSYYRIVAETEFGEPVDLEVVSSEADAVFRDDGSLRIGAAGDLKNTSGSIVLRASSNGTEALLTIPLRFR